MYVAGDGTIYLVHSLPFPLDYLFLTTTITITTLLCYYYYYYYYYYNFFSTCYTSSFTLPLSPLPPSLPLYTLSH